MIPVISLKNGASALTKKGEVPDVWRKVRAIMSSQHMRGGKSEYLGFQFGAPCYRRIEYEPKKDPLGVYTNEALVEMLSESEEQLRLFWHNRLNGHVSMSLFEEPYGWSVHCHRTGIEFEYPGRTPAYPKRVEEYYPNESIMRLFVLLTEEPFDFECAFLTKATFQTMDGIIDKVDRAKLVRVLHPTPLGRLIHALEGRDVADLLTKCYETDSHRNSAYRNRPLFQKITDVFDKMYLKEKPFSDPTVNGLAEYLILNPDLTVIRILRDVGESGNTVAENAFKQIIERMEESARLLNETLDSLRGKFST